MSFVLINKYSTGLFVSYSWKNPIAQNDICEKGYRPLKNSSKISLYLSNLWRNISGIKQIVYQPKIFGIWSLFVLFCLVWHRIVDTETNTAIAYMEMVVHYAHKCLSDATKQVKTLELFVSIQFEIDQIVCAWPNIAVT